MHICIHIQSANMQQVYRRVPMLKFHFNQTALAALLKSHTLLHGTFFASEGLPLKSNVTNHKKIESCDLPTGINFTDNV